MTDKTTTKRINHRKMYCPKCGEEYDDFDGFGVLYCEECGYCTHASITDRICDFCHKEPKDKRVGTLTLKKLNSLCHKVKKAVACDHRWTIISLYRPNWGLMKRVIGNNNLDAVAICCKCLEKRYV